MVAKLAGKGDDVKSEQRQTFIAIYIRVSTDEQAEHGNSIDVQKDRLIAFCASQGWDNYKLYIDDGYTGTNMNRPALKRMIRHIEEKKISGVLVMKLDRLSRKQKECLYLIEDVFEKNNIAFTSSSEKIDTSTPFGKAMVGVLAVFAQLDRDMIVERTTAGRRESVNKGQWYGGRIPFGYSWNKEAKQLEIVPEEAQIVREIFRRYLTGQSRLMIAEWVSDRSKARVFDHSVIRDILSRPIYMGKLHNNGKLVDGKHEAIVDADIWYSAQRESADRKEGSSPCGEYLLTGVLACGVCGGNVVHVKRTTRARGKVYAYELYACKNQHVREKDRDNNCSLGYHPRDKVENFVAEEIKSMSLNPDKYSEIIAQKNDSETNDSETIDAINTKIQLVSEGLDNLYDAIQSGNLKASSVSNRITKLEAERESLETQLEDLIDLQPATLKPDNTLHLIRQVGEAWDYMTEEEQKSMVRKLMIKVTLNKGGLHSIKWNIK